MITDYSKIDINTLNRIYREKQDYLKKAKTLMNQCYWNPEKPDWDISKFEVIDTIMMALCTFYDVEANAAADIKEVLKANH